MRTSNNSTTTAERLEAEILSENAVLTKRWLEYWGL